MSKPPQKIRTKITLALPSPFSSSSLSDLTTFSFAYQPLRLPVYALPGLLQFRSSHSLITPSEIRARSPFSIAGIRRMGSPSRAGSGSEPGGASRLSTPARDSAFLTPPFLGTASELICLNNALAYGADGGGNPVYPFGSSNTESFVPLLVPCSPLGSPPQDKTLPPPETSPPHSRAPSAAPALGERRGPKNAHHSETAASHKRT
ncbi:hypothetical protein B0H13DRAFT_2336789 [Mycena leptocephala]|nr:hypothetical protein B0H13DRAFT_2336789 [Mycena leptocephala]